MNKYAVISKYYDDGRIEKRVQICTDETLEIFEEHDTFDLYVDLFDTLDDVEDFASQLVDE